MIFLDKGPEKKEPLFLPFLSTVVQFHSWSLSNDSPILGDRTYKFLVLLWHCHLCPRAASSQDCTVGVGPELRNGIFSADGVSNWESTFKWSFCGFFQIKWRTSDFAGSILEHEDTKISRILIGWNYLIEKARERRGHTGSNYWSAGPELSFLLENSKGEEEENKGKKGIKKLDFLSCLINSRLSHLESLSLKYLCSVHPFFLYTFTLWLLHTYTLC